MGITFSIIIASGGDGFPISHGLGQGATMVAALRGVFMRRESRTASVGADRRLGSMFAGSFIGLARIITAEPGLTGPFRGN